MNQQAVTREPTIEDVSGVQGRDASLLAQLLEPAPIASECWLIVAVLLRPLALSPGQRACQRLHRTYTDHLPNRNQNVSSPFQSPSITYLFYNPLLFFSPVDRSHQKLHHVCTPALFAEIAWLHTFVSTASNTWVNNTFTSHTFTTVHNSLPCPG